MGPNPISRAATRDPQMPQNQGYFGTGGPEFVPLPYAIFDLPGPVIGTVAPASLGIGTQWAPGQGGDTPGGGGAATRGMTHAVETGWIKDGYVVPAGKVVHHAPGTVSWVGSRRGGA